MYLPTLLYVASANIFLLFWTVPACLSDENLNLKTLVTLGCREQRRAAKNIAGCHCSLMHML